MEIYDVNSSFLSIFSFFYLELLDVIFMFCLIVEKSVEKKIKCETHISAVWFQKMGYFTLIKSCAGIWIKITVFQSGLVVLPFSDFVF